METGTNRSQQDRIFGEVTQEVSRQREDPGRDRGQAAINEPSAWAPGSDPAAPQRPRKTAVASTFLCPLPLTGDWQRMLKELRSLKVCFLCLVMLDI